MRILALLLVLSSAPTFGSTLIAQSVPLLIVECGQTAAFPYEGNLTVVVQHGGNAVAVASGIIAHNIADKWACSICGNWPQGPVWGCQKGGTGPANPSHFTETAPPVYHEGTNTWTFVGTYSGGIDVTCRDC